MYALPALQEHQLVALGPYTGSTQVRHWDPNFYFLRTDPMSGLYAHVWYATTYLRVLRLGFMYLTDVVYGDDEYAAAVSLLRGMGYALSGVFRLTGARDWSASDAEFQAEWERFAETRPQAVIIFGRPSPTTALFVEKMLSDSRTSTAYLLSPLGIQNTLISSWRAAVAAGAPLVPGRVITTGANPLATDTRYDAVRRFQTVMADYLENSGQTDYNDSHYFLTDDVMGETMVGGWIAGEILTQILASADWLRSREVFARALFNQRRYVVEDLVIGDFGGDCSGRAASQGATCRCNQGGRTVLIKIFGEGFSANVMPDAEFTYPLYNCYPTSRRLLTPINAVTFVATDSRRGRYGMGEILGGGRAALPPPLQRAREFTLTPLSGTKSEIRAALMAEKEERHVDIFGGLVLPPAFTVPNLTFIDPIGLYMIPRFALSNAFYLSPTLDQGFFRLAEFLVQTGVMSVHAVMVGEELDSVVSVLRRTLVTFNLQLTSLALFPPGTSVIPSMPRDGWVFLVGIDTDDAIPMVNHVNANPGLRVLIPFSEHNTLYSLFGTLTVNTTTDRIIYATSLPHWNDPNTKSEVVQNYHAAVTNVSLRSPLSLQGFAIARAIMAIGSVMDVITAELFEETIYSRIVLTVDDMVYGPFARSDPARCSNVVPGDCLVNYGATSIAVWSLSRSIDPSVPPLSPPMTPSMLYTEPVVTGLTKAQLIGVIVGSVVGVVALITLFVVLLCCCSDSRDNNNAPKEPTDPVTLVFTDIESSTALWAACPEIMPDAVATHHRLIRSLIATYRCYEVKTIGDSFMIACKSAWAAVQLARDIQQMLLQYDWGSGAIDAAYHEFEEGRAAEDEEYVPPTARLDAAVVYQAYWSGLRVRVGVHTGLSDIRQDEVTKGYDYYGGASNTAARTESVGCVCVWVCTPGCLTSGRTR
ncbi:receptor-type adenylate cyclase [Trypanosoma grayi]|uniref:receptor-type adenylate cyclase n=1 Tax=Trypanosoma grayi TaxID=71804 RepID=UPI0004F43C89|nr:receptor-type adenylate cyclase [Trypanosoma grayi]KEG11169.1 receptor-type adenylate cyclase [Trypanosoma grayi]